MWQEIIAGLLVAGAAGFLTRRFWLKKATGKTPPGGCSTCSGCGKPGQCG